jgi:hypothetical protein
MVQKLLRLMEAHVEKVVVAACALFMVYVAWGYMLHSPNKIRFANQDAGPGQLHERIKEAADGLDLAVRNAKAEDSESQSFAKELKTRFEAGIFAKAAEDAPPLRPELRLASTFGDKITVPGLEEEPIDSVTLVTPLKPKPPVVESGRSMVFRKLLLVGSAEPPAGDDPEAGNEPVEQPWVTIGAHFDRQAQFKEMDKAGYAGYRARVYLAGVDVRRQEMLSNGEWSDWAEVAPKAAMPIVEIPEPAFDDDDGSLINKEDIDEAFATIKANQSLIEQPPFFVVDAGDEWDVPPYPWRLEMLAKIEEQEQTPERAPEATGRGMEARPGGGMGRPGGGGRPTGGGGIGRSGRGGGDRGIPSGPIAGSPTNERAAARRAIRQTLERAKEEYASKNYGQAINTAEGVNNMEGATTGDRKKAMQIVGAAEKKLEREARSMSSGGLVDRTMLQMEPILEPETQAPAIWFHDDTVESGKTYRYAMRVKLWNRYVGQTRSLKNKDDAKRPLIVGDWSVDSEPVTVTPSTHFFVSGQKPGDDPEAMVEVWKWRKGSWIKERFDVRVGDVIGESKSVKTDDLDEDLKPVKADVDFATRAVVLDLRLNDPVQQRIQGKGDFSYRDQESLVIVYLDPADGQVKKRSALLDRSDPLRKQLEEQEAF